jgi:hypothetical protein
MASPQTAQSLKPGRGWLRPQSSQLPSPVGTVSAACWKASGTLWLRSAVSVSRAERRLLPAGASGGLNEMLRRSPSLQAKRCQRANMPSLRSRFGSAAWPLALASLDLNILVLPLDAGRSAQDPLGILIFALGLPFISRRSCSLWPMNRRARTMGQGGRAAAGFSALCACFQAGFTAPARKWRGAAGAPRCDHPPAWQLRKLIGRAVEAS